MISIKDKYLELKSKKFSFLSLGDTQLDVDMGGLTPKAMHTIAGASKSGKSKFTSSRFIIEPYLDNISKGNPFNLQCAFYSFELDEVTVKFEFAAYFFYRDHNIDTFYYVDSTGKKHKLYISARYLQHNQYIVNTNNESEKVKVSETHEKLLFKILEERVEPMFDTYIWFRERRTNPTGIWKDVYNHMKNQGDLKEETYYREDGSSGQKIVSYKPHDPSLLQIVVIDHVRKLNSEKGCVTEKQKIDKLSDYCVKLRNIFEVSFALIIHTNRVMASVEKQKHLGDQLFPSEDEIKDSGRRIIYFILYYLLNLCIFTQIKIDDNKNLRII